MFSVSLTSSGLHRPWVLRCPFYASLRTFERNIIIMLSVSNMTILLIFWISDKDFMHMITHYSARAYYNIIRWFPGRLIVVRIMIYSGVMLCLGEYGDGDM